MGEGQMATLFYILIYLYLFLILIDCPTHNNSASTLGVLSCQNSFLLPVDHNLLPRNNNLILSRNNLKSPYAEK